MITRRLCSPAALLAGLLLLSSALPAGAQSGPSPIRGEAGTNPRTNEEVRAPSVVVTAVRVATHPGFDRIVFELAGEGQAGWMVAYEDDPRADGSGEPVEVAGDAALALMLTNIAPADEAPPGTIAWAGDVAGPSGGVVAEVVDVGMFEAQHTFYVGLDRERPFRIARLQAPQRVVIDVVAAATGGIADRDVPVGGVATGLGGTSSAPPIAPIAGLGLLLAGLGTAVARRHRSIRP